MNSSQQSQRSEIKRYDRCRVLITVEPRIFEGTNFKYQRSSIIHKINGDNKIEFDIFFSGAMRSSLQIYSHEQEMADIDLSNVNLNDGNNIIQLQTQLITVENEQYSLSIHLELMNFTNSPERKQSKSKSDDHDQLFSQPVITQQEYLTLDISASGIPIKQKCFSCFPSIPLAFYEIVCLNKVRAKSRQDNLQTEGQQQIVLYSSEITRMPSQDPVWMPSGKLNKLDLQPKFRINLYNSSDHAKSRQQLIGGCDIEYEILIDGRESMFELDDMENTHILVDRILYYNC